ncbi:hypothetical protein [Janthinobacterium sp. RB2P8]|uniref:hypothetical protein n=1 Tax=Janthinobacterium sp. RB2P8 TaxID=3424191 RepID=UPI003F24EDF7
MLAQCLVRPVDVSILQNGLVLLVCVMPAAPVFVAQLLARFFLSAKVACHFFDERLAGVVDGEGHAKRTLSGLP